MGPGTYYKGTRTELTDITSTVTSGFDYSGHFTIYESLYHGQERRKRLARSRGKRRTTKWLRRSN